MVKSTSKAIIAIDDKCRPHSESVYSKFKKETTVEGGSREYVSFTIYLLQEDFTPNEFLRFLVDADKLAKTMGWTSGPKNFDNFRQLLISNEELSVEWSRLEDETPNKTMATFAAAKASFAQSFLKKLKYEDQLEYMRNLKKPGPMSVHDFLRNLKALNRRAAMFPDANGGVGLSQTDLRRILFKAVPTAWQTALENSGKRYTEMSIDEVAEFMSVQEDHDPFVAKKPAGSSNSSPTTNGSSNGSRNTHNSRARGNSNRGNNNNNNSRNHNSRGNRHSGSGNGNSNGSNNSRGNNRIQPSDQCPLPGHGNHIWYDCQYNRHGRHGDNTRRPEGQGNSGGNRGEANATEASFEAHFIDAIDEGPISFDDPLDDYTTHADDGECFFCGIEGTPDEVEDDSTVESDPDDLPALIPRNTDWDDDSSIESDEGQDDIASVAEPSVPTFKYGPLLLSKTAYDLFEAFTTVDLAKGFLQTPLIPATMSSARTINGVENKVHFKTLIDHGASHGLIKKASLPKGVKLFSTDSIQFGTAAGSFRTQNYVYLEDFCLPEFNMTRRIGKVKMFVFDNDRIAYDCILGRDVLNDVGIDVKSSTLTCEWLGDSIPFKPTSFLKSTMMMRDVLMHQPELDEAEANLTFTATKSTVADVKEVVDEQSHLSEEQRSQLCELLSKHTKLFSGKLGRYPHRKFHIDLKPGTTPYHCKRPYPIPASLRPIVKQELDRQCEIGVLEKVYESLWGHPMLCIPKKDGAIRTVDDMRELNKCVLRRVYPLPKLMDMMRRHPEWKYVSALDLTLCYYTYELDEESSWMCVLVTPFGKYRRKRLSMGLAQSPDWAQGALEEALGDMLHEFVEAYIDDVGVFSNSWEDHLKHLALVLARLEDTGYTVNPAKCNWGVQQVEWMGHIISTEGLKPTPKKVQGILDIAPPTTLKQLRAFIGCVNFYRDFWKRRAHIMAPLTDLTKVPRKDFKRLWTSAHEKSFNETKAMVAKDILLAYPDPNKPFVVHTDASDYQLGGVIYQEKRPIAMWSRKLTAAQKRYPTPDKEAVCIIELLHAFRDMLYGTQIRIETDHRNLSQTNFTSLRLLRWRLAIEEFHPQIVYRPGADNTVADGLSRLPLLPSEEQGNPDLDDDQDLLHQTMVYYPEAINTFPLEFGSLSREQETDEDIQQKLQSGDYVRTTYGDNEIATKVINGVPRIVVPTDLREATIRWYHSILGHAGQDRMYKTLSRVLYIPGIKDIIKSFVESCDHCQRFKNNGQGYGFLPLRDDLPAPFHTIALDHVGPWTVEVPDYGKLQFSALTIIDIATTLCEIVRADSPSGDATAMLFENTWLSRYPRPVKAIYDAGTAFHSPEFKLSLHRNGITPVPITVKNPQSNAIVERAHKTIGDQIRTLQSQDPPDNIGSAYECIDSILATVQRAIRSATHTTLGYSPGSMVFNRDMLLDVPVHVDLDQAQQRRLNVAIRNNTNENQRRRPKNYVVGDEVMVHTFKPHKMGARAEGPFVITQVHVNGTVTIQRRRNVFERISIRRIKPYIRRA